MDDVGDAVNTGFLKVRFEVSVSSSMLANVKIVYQHQELSQAHIRKHLEASSNEASCNPRNKTGRQQKQTEQTGENLTTA